MRSSFGRDPHFPARSPRRPEPRAQEGSAYLIALMAMVVLAILGLSLGFITQTELLIGSAERNVQRVFYGAETGLSLATARALVSHDKRAADITLPTNPAFASGPDINMRIRLAPTYPVSAPPCNLCQVNRQTQYSGATYFNVRHAVTVRSRLEGSGGGVVAQKNLAGAIDIQPWQDALPPPGERGSTKVEIN